MSPRKKLLVLLLLLQSFIFLTESLSVRAEYSFDSWTTDDGLPQNGLREITQTPDGYLWFTTFDGLVRFDGVKFTTFAKGKTKGIINSRFTGIYCCDAAGAMYAATMEDGVLTVYRDGVFTSYTSEQVPGRYIERIKPDDRGEPRFLVVEENPNERSWYYLRDGKFIRDEVLYRNRPKIEYRGKSGSVWTLTPERIVENRAGEIIVYDYKIKKFTHTTEFFEDSGGALWVGSSGLVRLKDGRVEVFDKNPIFPKNADFHSLREEADGSIWFANGGRTGPGPGMVRLKDGKFSIYGKEEGLSDGSIFSVFKDREGVVWLATNKGLNRLRKKIIKTYSTADGLNSSEVYPIYRDERDWIWIGTTKGLNVFREGKFETVNLVPADKTEPEHLRWRNGEMSVLSLWKDSNKKMWVGVGGGIFIVEDGRARILRDSEGHHVHSIREDREGNVWAATNKGLMLYRDYRLERVFSRADGLPGDFFTIVYEDSRGRLWLGGAGGLTEFTGGRFINYTTADGLAGNYVRSIYEDADGTLWIGTYGEGLSRFKDGRFFSYREKNGLFNDDVFAIEEDGRGNFWISSNHGIYRVRRQELNDLAEGRINKIASVGYGKEDGMRSTECNGGRQPAGIRDKDGNFWFPTQDGVVVINPEFESFNPLPPPVIIESATVEREPVEIGQGLFVEAGRRNIEINFTGLSLIKSKQIKFKYKLEGHDHDWIDAGTRRTAYYSYLPPGNYRFLVQAANSDGVWNEKGAALDIKLTPFFYQTRLFYLSCAVVALLLLLSVWKISVHQLKARERKLARLVAEKTEELHLANEELRHLANSDGLTSVGNRRLFEEFLTGEWHRAIRFKTEISLILLDVDHFKLFNDTYSHQAGDECLKKVAGALRETINRPTDMVTRFGGEEFAIILGGTDAEGALVIARQAMDNVRELNIPHAASKTCDRLTVSIGVATTFPGYGMSELDFIEMADRALYRAKETGRNRIIISDAAFREDEVLNKEFLTG